MHGGFYHIRFENNVTLKWRYFSRKGKVMNWVVIGDFLFNIWNIADLRCSWDAVACISKEIVDNTSQKSKNQNTINQSAKIV
jgi:hypothetical protein